MPRSVLNASKKVRSIWCSNAFTSAFWSSMKKFLLIVFLMPGKAQENTLPFATISTVRVTFEVTHYFLGTAEHAWNSDKYCTQILMNQSSLLNLHNTFHKFVDLVRRQILNIRYFQRTEALSIIHTCFQVPQRRGNNKHRGHPLGIYLRLFSSSWIVCVDDSFALPHECLIQRHLLQIEVHSQLIDDTF